MTRMTVGTRSGVALLPEVPASPAAELVCSAVRSSAFELFSAIMVGFCGLCRRAWPSAVLKISLPGVAHNPQHETLSQVDSGFKNAFENTPRTVFAGSPHLFVPETCV